MFNQYIFIDTFRYLRNLQFEFERRSPEFRCVDRYFDMLNVEKFSLRDLMNCYSLIDALERRLFNGKTKKSISFE